MLQLTSHLPHLLFPYFICIFISSLQSINDSNPLINQLIIRDATVLNFVTL